MEKFNWAPQTFGEIPLILLTEILNAENIHFGPPLPEGHKTRKIGGFRVKSGKLEITETTDS